MERFCMRLADEKLDVCIYVYTRNCVQALTALISCNKTLEHVT